MSRSFCVAFGLLFAVGACTTRTITTEAPDAGTELAEEGEAKTPPAGCKDTIPTSQGPSEPCCSLHGLDACGAGLFCAAFDGRTVTTCYPEHSRASGQDCSAHVQCASSLCKTTSRRCAAMPGTACTLDDGCAPDSQGGVYLCQESRNGAHLCMPR
ncbi:MAG TPA: hypothetical protein VM925_24625 [Labilithrix sp.]|nr:hypothetical protein [Labilithrix sp.]